MTPQSDHFTALIINNQHVIIYIKKRKKYFYKGDTSEHENIEINYIQEKYFLLMNFGYFENSSNNKIFRSNFESTSMKLERNSKNLTKLRIHRNFFEIQSSRIFKVSKFKNFEFLSSITWKKINFNYLKKYKFK